MGLLSSRVLLVLLLIIHLASSWPSCASPVYVLLALRADGSPGAGWDCRQSVLPARG